MWITSGFREYLHKESNITQSLERKSTSDVYHSWNDKWYDNVDKLYNFKHIINNLK